MKNQLADRASASRCSQRLKATTRWLPLALLTALCGCGTPNVQFGQRPINPVATYSHVQTVQGLTVAVEPIVATDEVVDLFGMDLLKGGVLPVLVVASNISPVVSHVVAPDQFALVNAHQGTHSDQANRAASTGGCGSSHLDGRGVGNWAHADCCAVHRSLGGEDFDDQSKPS